MTITYENTDDDAAETQVFRIFGIPHTRKAMRAGRIMMGIMALMFLGLQLFLFTLRPGAPFFLFPVLMMGMMAMLYTPPLYRLTFRQQVKNKQTAYTGASDRGRRTVTPRPDGLFVTAEGLSDTLIKWDAIDEITLQKKYLFIRWGGMQILTIPRRAFASIVQESAFLDEIAHYRTALPPLPAILSTLPEITEATPVASVTPVAAPVVTAPTTPTAPTATTNHTPWWQGQTLSSLDNETTVSVKQQKD